MTINKLGFHPCRICYLLILLAQSTQTNGQKNSKSTLSPLSTQSAKTVGKMTKGLSPAPTTLQSSAPSSSPSSSFSLLLSMSPTTTTTRHNSFAPSPVLVPAEAPSFAPLIQLTYPPTALPSSVPTMSPTSRPSSSPSIVISPIAVSTNASTLSPSTLAATKSSTKFAPSSRPTQFTHSPSKVAAVPSASLSLTSVALPLLGISFDEIGQQNDLNSSRLQELFSSWLSGYLVTNTEFGPSLDHVDLQVVQTLQNPVRRRRLQPTGIGSLNQVNVVFNGSAYFTNAAQENKKTATIPSPADLFNTLDNFFSKESGVQALQDILSIIVTLDTTHGVQVFLNGGLITPPTTSTASISTTTKTTSPGKHNSLGLYLGLGLGVLVLSIALVLVFRLRRKRVFTPSTSRLSGTSFFLFRRRDESERLAAAAALQQARIGASPREKEVVFAGSDYSVQSAISYDDSMFTPDVDAPYRHSTPQSPGSYDVRRLERVIRSAKEIVKELSDDESLYLRSI